MQKQDQIMLLFSIIERGKGKKYMDMMDENNIKYHMQMTGFGTAPSETLDLFGIGSTDKDIIISLAPNKVVGAFVSNLGKNLGTNFQYGGLMLCVSLSAINRLTSEVISRASGKNSEKEAKGKMVSENKHLFILVSVNQGYADKVMQTARKAGATGGTILRARLAESEDIIQPGETEEQDEKEVLTILAPVNTATQIMNEINREHGLTSEAHGTVLALPVERAFKI